MAEEPSLDSLPIEILYHNLLPYLSRYDIFTLRQVNHYFNEIFTSDDCWRRFVIFPLKYILCDLKSRSTVPGVAEVLQDILQQGESRRWLAYCRLQEAHLRNWMSRRDILYDTINLSIKDLASLEEVVDNNNEHWICLSVRKTLCFWNITAQPQSLDAIYVGSHSLVRLLPCRKVLVKGLEGCILAVYELIPEENSIRLNYLFRFDEETPRNNLNAGMDPGNLQLSWHFRFILLNHIFIGYMCQLPTPRDWFLHVWNLVEERKWYTVGLEDIIQVFQTYLSGNGVEAKQRFHLSLFEGESPCVIVVLKYISNNITYSQIHLFDIDSRQFKYLITQRCSEVLACLMFHSKILIDEKVPSGGSFFSRVSVHSLQTHDEPGPGLRVLAEHEQFDQSGLSQRRFINEFSFNGLHSVVLKNSKAIIRTSNEVVIIITNPQFHRIEISMDDKYEVLGFIEPKVLLMYDSGRNPTETQVRVYNIYNGRQTRCWERVNIDASRFKRYFSNLVYPSKLILNVESQEQLRIYNF